MAETTLGPEVAPAAGPLAGEIIGAGVAAGVIGGVVMAVWGALATTAKGLGFFAIPQLIGATFMKPDSLLHPVAMTLWGTVLHLLVSAAWGVLFASLIRRETPPGASLLAGLAYAIGIFLLMVFVVVPVTNQVMADRSSMLLGNLFIMHLLFGACVSLAPMFRRRIAYGSNRADGNGYQRQREEREAQRADNLPRA
jgi:hypothetical protein